MRSSSIFVVLCGALALAACVRQPPTNDITRELPLTKLTLCNDTASSLRVRPNWMIIFPIAPGRCTTAEVPIGLAMLTVSTVVQPADSIHLPAARVEIPPAGALVRYGDVGGFVGITRVEGSSAWSRCGYSAGVGPRPPRSLINTLWREDLERWMRHYLVCEPTKA